MNSPESLQFEIQSSKKKVLLRLAGSVIFVVLGALMLLNPDTSHQPPVFNQAIGLASILFFGGCAVAWLRVLFHNKPLLSVNEIGIDYSQMRLITWDQIKGFRIFDMETDLRSAGIQAAMKLAAPGARIKAKFIVVDLVDTDKFIESFPKWRYPLMKMNYGMCGSPVCIAPNITSMSLDDLLNKMNEALAYYKK
jgi:hypothetical protein